MFLHLFFILKANLGSGEAKEKIMDNNAKLSYEKPLVEVLEFELETSILTGSGDPTITNPDMGWGAQEKRGSWGNFWE